ncbi:MAG: hypothetical protein HGB05_10500 [Chloroflexi bacterium]|nr:hypothetical protein [Chloroflexota bacterium]
MLHKLSTAEIDADRAILKAIEELHDYQSVNPTYSTAGLQQLNQTLIAAQEAKTRMRLAYQQACAIESDTARMFHDAVRLAKTQVVAQYGDDSYAMQAIGLTRRSARKRPTRKVSSSI